MPCTFAFEAIGTAWKITLFEELPLEREAVLLRLIEARIEEFDRVYSRFRPDSIVTQMSRCAGTYTLPDGGPLLDLYAVCHRVTNGAFTPLIGQTLSDAGYDAGYSFQPKPLTPPPAWEDVMKWEGSSLTITRPALLDFGAAGKGYLVDLIGSLLEGEGVRTFCIDAGGDILYRGDMPIRVGLEDPEHTDQAVGVATVSDGSVCGSAGNRRAWGEFHHMIDPRTLASPRHILATWTFAPTARIADALATCLYFSPAEPLRRAFEFEYVILYADRHAECSPRAPVELFTP